MTLELWTVLILSTMLGFVGGMGVSLITERFMIGQLKEATTTTQWLETEEVK